MLIEMNLNSKQHISDNTVFKSKTALNAYLQGKEAGRKEAYAKVEHDRKVIEKNRTLLNSLPIE